jgi:hypothetical protein
MDHDLICSWLGLPPGTWPPDHYRLLGLQPGESNTALIEQRVHERLDAVRCYQITHPEQATEAMNRLAQAFVCLTEPTAKKTYDAQLGISAPPSPAETPASPPTRATPVPPSPPPPPAPQAPPLDWLSSPPFPSLPAAPPPVSAPVLNYAATPPPLPILPMTGETSGPPAVTGEMPVSAAELPMAIPVPPPLPVGPPLEPVDPVLETAQSGPARRGIATKRRLYQRIVHTRRLLRLWNELGKYISSPKRRLNRSTEGPELVRLLHEITGLLKQFPPLLGEAGQPGYLVLALTHVDTVKVFQSFSPHQREALSRDWGVGVKLLTAHCDFLRQELRALRRRSWRQRFLRASWALIVEQPGTVLLLLALLAINVALWRSYAQELWEMLFSR